MKDSSGPVIGFSVREKMSLWSILCAIPIRLWSVARRLLGVPPRSPAEVDRQGQRRRKLRQRGARFEELERREVF